MEERSLVATALTRHLGITAAVLRKWTQGWPKLEAGLNPQGKKIYSQEQVELLELFKQALEQEPKFPISALQTWVEQRWKIEHYKQVYLPQLKELKHWLESLKTETDN